MYNWKEDLISQIDKKLKSIWFRTKGGKGLCLTAIKSIVNEFGVDAQGNIAHRHNSLQITNPAGEKHKEQGMAIMDEASSYKGDERRRSRT